MIARAKIQSNPTEKRRREFIADRNISELRIMFEQRIQAERSARYVAEKRHARLLRLLHRIVDSRPSIARRFREEIVSADSEKSPLFDCDN